MIKRYSNGLVIKVSKGMFELGKEGHLIKVYVSLAELQERGLVETLVSKFGDYLKLDMLLQAVDCNLIMDLVKEVKQGKAQELVQ